MPQTIEAIDHSKAAEVPIIVAINKMDRPNADATRVRNELLSHELVDESMGGDILSVEVSAVEKTNLDTLLEAIVLQSELLEINANPDRSAEGVVVGGKGTLEASEVPFLGLPPFFCSKLCTSRFLILTLIGRYLRAMAVVISQANGEPAV